MAIICLCTIVTFGVSQRYFRRWGTVCARSFFWSTSRGRDGILPGATEAHLIPLVRVMATERRRSWLYFAGNQFRKTGASVLLFVVLRGSLNVTVCYVLQTYKQLRCAFGPSHSCLQQRKSQQTSSQQSLVQRRSMHDVQPFSSVDPIRHCRIPGRHGLTSRRGTLYYIPVLHYLCLHRLLVFEQEADESHTCRS